MLTLDRSSSSDSSENDHPKKKRSGKNKNSQKIPTKNSKAISSKSQIGLTPSKTNSPANRL
jgi:hypothetical protein